MPVGRIVTVKATKEHPSFLVPAHTERKHIPSVRSISASEHGELLYGVEDFHSTSTKVRSLERIATVILS